MVGKLCLVAMALPTETVSAPGPCKLMKCGSQTLLQYVYTVYYIVHIYIYIYNIYVCTNRSSKYLTITAAVSFHSRRCKEGCLQTGRSTRIPPLARLSTTTRWPSKAHGTSQRRPLCCLLDVCESNQFFMILFPWFTKHGSIIATYLDLIRGGNHRDLLQIYCQTLVSVCQVLAEQHSPTDGNQVTHSKYPLPLLFEHSSKHIHLWCWIWSHRIIKSLQIPKKQPWTCREPKCLRASIL